MAKATAKQCVNLHKNQKSHLILTDPAGRFTKDTTVTNPVTDLNNGTLTFTGTALWNKGSTATRLIVKLTGNFEKSVKDDITPVSGLLSITLSDPTSSIPVSDTPVDYVDDDNP
jgi:hypothetical protein